MANPPDVVAESGIRVLIADDDRPFRDSLRDLIERQPELSVVGSAANGLQAIELADALDPDAVVIDLHMPLLDGVTAAARLRRDHPNVCLIALTGDEAPALHRAVREAGADEVLLKDELVGVLIERLAAARRRSVSARARPAAGPPRSGSAARRRQRPGSAGS
jgi:DNA-binding NarL/FixJ family response regulator